MGWVGAREWWRDYIKRGREGTETETSAADKVRGGPAVTLSVCLGKRDASSAVVVVGLGGDDEAGKSSMVVSWIYSSTATPRSSLPQRAALFIHLSRLNTEVFLLWIEFESKKEEDFLQDFLLAIAGLLNVLSP
jgi:hypothetical protein